MKLHNAVNIYHQHNKAAILAKWRWGGYLIVGWHRQRIGCVTICTDIRQIEDHIEDYVGVN